MSEYWKACLEEIFENHNVSLTEEQFSSIVDNISSAHDMCSEYSGPVPECKPQKKEVTVESVLEKINVCSKCNGTGHTVMHITNSHVSYYSCKNCNGRGFIFDG